MTQVQHWAWAPVNNTLVLTEQLDQRQTENGKMITGNPREQLHPTALQAIGANRAEKGIALAGNIRV